LVEWDGQVDRDLNPGHSHLFDDHPQQTLSLREVKTLQGSQDTSGEVTHALTEPMAHRQLFVRGSQMLLFPFDVVATPIDLLHASLNF
jgi:hypothetical protein